MRTSLSIMSSLQIPKTLTTYQPKVIQKLEDYKTFLVNDPTTRVEVIDNQLANKYKGDFYGLLLSLGISLNYHWIIMRMNGLASPEDYKGTELLICIPSTSVIDTLISRVLN